MGAYDILGVFSDNENIAAAAYSENFIDLGVTSPKIGVGQHAPYLCIRTAVAATSTDSFSIELRASATNDGTDLDGTVKTIMMPLAGVANAGSGVNEVLGSDARLSAAGAWIYRGPIPYETDLRYLQLYYNNTITDGNTWYVDAWLSDGPNSTFRGSQVLFSTVGQP